MNCCRSFTRLTVPQCLSFSVFIWQPVQTKDKYSLVTYSLIGLNCVMCCVIAGVIIRVCEKVQSSGTCVVCGGSASKKYHFTSCKCCNCYGNTNRKVFHMPASVGPMWSHSVYIFPRGTDQWMNILLWQYKQERLFSCLHQLAPCGVIQFWLQVCFWVTNAWICAPVYVKQELFGLEVSWSVLVDMLLPWKWHICLEVNVQTCASNPTRVRLR